MTKLIALARKQVAAGRDGATTPEPPAPLGGVAAEVHEVCPPARWAALAC